MSAHKLMSEETLLIDDNLKKRIVERWGMNFELVTQERSLVKILESLVATI